MQITMNGRYKTKGGWAVRILCVDGPGDQCVIGIIEGDDDPETWTKEGIWSESIDNNDLVNADGSTKETPCSH